MKKQTPAERAPGLDQKLAFLGDPGSYPDSPPQVEIKETHLSWVFLAGKHVYKLKKPLRRPHLDFRSSESRRLNAEAEVLLNRRLAPDVYLGTVPLTWDAESGLGLGGKGAAIDTLVAMRRLPEALALDRVIEAGRFRRDVFAPAAARLARFFCEARPDRQPPSRYLARLERERQENHRGLLRPELEATPAELEHLEALQRRALSALKEALAARGERVIEGHGDLRPEHVFLTSPPVVIDCLEFDRSLRLLDPLEEIALLGLECEALGEPRVLAQLLAVYGAASREDRQPRVVAFYKSLRASLRARLALQHFDEPDPRKPELWPRQARRYFEIALHAAEESLDGPAQPSSSSTSDRPS